jgi:hypothetical protein
MEVNYRLHTPDAPLPATHLAKGLVVFTAAVEDVRGTSSAPRGAESRFFGIQFRSPLTIYRV